MATSMSIAKELLSAINTDYTSNVYYLNPDKVTMDTAVFEDTELAKQYCLDTATCVIGYGKCCRINVNNLYDIFGSYSLDNAATVKANALAEIDQNPECYQEASHIVFVMKGTTFKKWLESMCRPCTRPDELMLYVLCVLYQCDCVVYTKWQPWHTVNPNSGLSFNMIEEMCETKLLYIGQNLFGVLCRLPLNRPITPPIVLPDVQASRLLTRDISHNIHLTIMGVTRQHQPITQRSTANDTDSSSESTIANQHSGMASTLDTTNEDKKLVKVESSNDKLVPLDIFGDAYAALIATPKVEPEETNTTKVATLNQHSNLQISNVYTLGTAIKDEPSDSTDIITIDPMCKLHGNSTGVNLDTLQETTSRLTTTLEANCTVPPVSSDLPLPEATSLQVDTLQEPTLPFEYTSEASCIATQVLCELSLPEATSLQEATTAKNSVTDKDISNDPILLNTVSSTVTVLGPSIALDSVLQDLEQHPPKSINERLLPTENEPPKQCEQPELDSHTQSTVYDIPAEQYIEEDTNRSKEIPPCLNDIGSEQVSAVIEQPNDSCAKSSALKTDVYYSILTVEQDDIIYLHHKDIVNRTCIVNVEKLTQADIQLARATCHNSTLSLGSSSGVPVTRWK